MLDTSIASESRDSTAPIAPGPTADIQRQQLRDELALHMGTAVTQFRGTDPMSQHRIPKLRYTYRLTSAVSIINQDILPQYLEAVENLEDLQFMVYSAAVAVVETLGLLTRPQGEDGTRPDAQKPVWMRRLESRIATLRLKVGRLQYK